MNIKYPLDFKTLNVSFKAFILFCFPGINCKPLNEQKVKSKFFLSKGNLQESPKKILYYNFFACYN